MVRTMKDPASKSLLLTGIVLGLSNGTWNCTWAEGNDFGKMAYLSGCAQCHGVDGKGDGPKSSELKTKPPDLTVLAKNNSGVLPVQSTYEIIDGRKSIPADGTRREMPIWGEAFLSFGPDSQRIPQNRIMAIIDYLERIQVR